MASEWSTKKSKKGKKKKAAQHLKPSQKKESAKKQKRSQQRTKQRRGGRNHAEGERYGDENNNSNRNRNMYDNDGGARNAREPALSKRQLQIMRQISNSNCPEFSDSKYDAILPRVIQRLDLTYFDANNEQMKFDILTELMNELQDGLGGNKSKSKSKSSALAQDMATGSMSMSMSPRQRSPRSSARDRGDARSRSTRQQRQSGYGKQWKRAKSGNFYRMMTASNKSMKRCIGNVVLDYVFSERENYQTVFNLLREFAFILKDERILSASQRLKLYTSPNDILYRSKAFDMALDCNSTLRLFELRKCPKDLSTMQCVKLIIGNVLNLDWKFRAKYEKMPIVSMNVASKNIDGFSFVDKILAQRCKQLNVWNANDIQDLNKAYLIEFVEYQKTQNFAVSQPYKREANEQRDGEIYLDYFHQFILNMDLVKRKNMKSLHFGYIKVINNFEVERHLFAFAEVKATKVKEMRQFMVWNGECGVDRYH